MFNTPFCEVAGGCLNVLDVVVPFFGRVNPSFYLLVKFILADGFFKGVEEGKEFRQFFGDDNCFVGYTKFFYPPFNLRLNLG